MAISTSAGQTPSQNRLLAALPAADFARLQPHLELVSLPLGWAVYEAGGTQGYVYFPINAIVSLLYVMEDGSSAEIRSEEHTSELQSRSDLVCRLLLEKKKKNNKQMTQ